MKKLFMIAGALALSAGTMVSAATLSIDGGIFDSIPGGTTGLESPNPQNNVLDALTGIPNSEATGFLGSKIVLNKDARLRVELIGWEAGQANKFTIDGTTIGRQLGEGNLVVGNPLSEFFTGFLTAGDLEFEFTSTDRQTQTADRGGVANGANTLGQGEKSFFATFGEPNVLNTEATEKRTGNVLWLFYDDNGVPGDNHDDLVVRISAVPLPAGMLLLMTGMGALVLRRRKS